jgi:hypothetical protein
MAGQASAEGKVQRRAEDGVRENRRHRSFVPRPPLAIAAQRERTDSLPSRRVPQARGHRDRPDVTLVSGDDDA